MHITGSGRGYFTRALDIVQQHWKAERNSRLEKIESKKLQCIEFYQCLIRSMHAHRSMQNAVMTEIRKSLRFSSEPSFRPKALLYLEKTANVILHQDQKRQRWIRKCLALSIAIYIAIYALTAISKELSFSLSFRCCTWVTI